MTRKPRSERLKRTSIYEAPSDWRLILDHTHAFWLWQSSFAHANRRIVPKQEAGTPPRPGPALTPWRTGHENALFDAPFEKDWLTAGEKITVTFPTALDRDLFRNEVSRLLPGNLLRFDAETDNEPASP
jgi:hypothetical protein